MIWLTADQHFYHKLLIRPWRPFDTVEEMNRVLIERYNERVSSYDTIIMLGDFAFCDMINMRLIMSQLNGFKILVRGNHDRSARKMLQVGFNRVYSHLTLDAGGQTINLSHFPYRIENPPDDYDQRCWEWRLPDDGRYLFHGHVHHVWKQRGKMINVGVDVRDFAPVSLDELLEIIQ